MTELKRSQQASRDADASVFVIHSSMKLQEVKEFFDTNRNDIRAVYIHPRYDDGIHSILHEVKRLPHLQRLKFLDTNVGIRGKKALESYLVRLLEKKPRLKYVEFESRDGKNFPITPEIPRFRLAIRRQGREIVEAGINPGGFDRLIKTLPPPPPPPSSDEEIIAP